MEILLPAELLGVTPRYVFETENRSLVPDTNAALYDIPAPELEKHDPLHVFRKHISRIAEVERVMFSYQSIPGGRDIIHLFSVIDADVKDIRKRVYSVEKALMERFSKQEYMFNFHVIARRGRPITDLVSDKGVSTLYEKSKPGTDAIGSGAPKEGD
jgi:hypothetical protein